MLNETTLTIRLFPGVLNPRSGDIVVNEYRGGPETLLRWLETQLGLAGPSIPPSSRVTEYAEALDAVTEAVFSTSLATDRWATASELLRRRDELLLAGWQETDHAALPPLVRDLCHAAAGRKFEFPGEAVRLRRVMAALDEGQTLPPHRCVLVDPIEQWPALWRDVLSKLTSAVPAEPLTLAPVGTALRHAQSLVREATSAKFTQDSSLRYLVTRSETAACEFVASALASAPEKLSSTVIYCEDDSAALRLDASLRRLGLPTMGAALISSTHPVLQVLPLCLSLCWEPCDPQALLDFLTLPVMPLARPVATRLARSLTDEPGLGSSEWDKAVSELCSEDNDPDGKVRQRIHQWLLCERVPRGTPIPSRLVRERSGLVAQWASVRARHLEDDASALTDLVDALQIAAGQASLFGDLVECQGTEVTEPQLARLLDEALSIGVQTAPCIEADRGPIRVRSLAEIDAPCSRLVWLGLGTADARGSRWSASELRKLREAGFDLDDGSRELTSLRAAEARGLGFIQESLLAVLVPQDWERRWHPLWLAIRNRLENAEQPPVLEDLIAAGSCDSIAPFVFAVDERSIEPPQPQRLAWTVPSELLHERETVSASELQDRLGCPLKWVLNYQAKLRPSRIAKLPENHTLKGTFCHSVLERVFGDGGPLPSTEQAVEQVAQVFDERLPLDAAPLAQADQLIERQRLRRELLNATRILVGTLSAGGYHIVGIEEEVASEAFGKSLTGWIDCVAARDDGSEAIIDFKYAGRNKYRDLIQDGRAVQLATYAYARSRGGAAFPSVAYLVLADAQFYTPSGSPVDGDGNRFVLNAPAIQTVWGEFAAALDVAGEWLAASEPIPARPLHVVSDWPDGSTIVLKDKLKDNEVQDVCRYCDYQRLCGLEETK